MSSEHMSGEHSSGEHMSGEHMSAHQLPRIHLLAEFSFMILSTIRTNLIKFNSMLCVSWPFSEGCFFNKFDLQ